MQYRCFFLNLRSTIVSVEIVEAENDTDALRLSAMAFDEQGHQFTGFEVWEGSRLVHRQTKAAHV
jgi:hypothetical protein